MTYTLSKRSLGNLEGVHPNLVRVIKRAIEITTVDFMVIEGLRTLERQKQLKKQGFSRTLRSRHLKAPNGYGHAVDVVPYVDMDQDGTVESHEMFSWAKYPELAKAIKKAAEELGVPIEWGGDWRRFRDGPHWQLPWKQYPGT